MDLATLSATAVKKGLSSKQFSSTEVTQACLNRIKKLESRLNAFVTVTAEEALKSAQEADKRLSQGLDLPLLGVPLAIKDNFNTRGIKTTASSKVLDSFIPPYDATVVRKLKDAGMVMLGKTNMDAWAHGSSGENSDYKPTKNPWNEAYVPGGSSSGSAAAVAADMCIAATGSDTGGSIRLPASFTNVVGIKPTYGRVSRYGVVAMASSLDVMGHLTKTVADSALLLNVTAGVDQLDATTLDKPVPDYTQLLGKSIKGLRIGVPKEYHTQGLDDRVKQAVDASITVLKQQGANIVDISLPYTEYAIACYYIIMPAEVSSNLARYDGIRYGNDRSFFAKEAKLRIMLGSYTLSSGYYDAYYKKAMQVRTLIKKDFDDAWSKVDVILAPVSPTPPWKFGEKTSDPLKMYLSDIFTATANLAGIPALAVPAGFVDGLPIGIQFLGPQFSEQKLYQVADAYEQATQWHEKRPSL